MDLAPFIAKASSLSQIGSKGETEAIRFLRKKGLRILTRNWRFGKKEIDIIAQEGGTICFIEVKTRGSLEFGLPQEAIDFKKRKSLITLAVSYINRYGLKDYNFRFDVVSVLWERNKRKAKIEYIKNAFGIEERWEL